MLTTVAFYESKDPAGAWAALAAIADQHVYTADTDLTVPELAQVVAVAAGVASGANELARLSSPSLRDISLPLIHPVNGVADADTEPDADPKVTDLRTTPLILRPNEALNAEVHSTPTAARAQWVIVWLADGVIAPVTGEIITVRATNTDTLDAGEWTNGNLTLDEDLPVGHYQVVGIRAISAGLVAVRIVPRGGRWRPGVLGCDAANDADHHIFRMGQMGVFCEFASNMTPSMDFLSISGDSDQEVFLDLIRISETL